MITKNGSIQLHFPLWKFLAQIVLVSTSETILNPCRFWHNYKIKFLEKCWNYEVIQLLEDCLDKELELEESEPLPQPSIQK